MLVLDVKACAMHDTPVEIMAHDGSVLVHRPGSATVIMTAEGARHTAALLTRAAVAAEADQSGRLGSVQPDNVRVVGSSLKAAHGCADLAVERAARRPYAAGAKGR